MPELLFGRSVHFTASHFYWLPTLSEAENRLKFGAVADEHEHEYRLTVWLSGLLDESSMMAVDLPHVDRVLFEQVTQPFHKQCINRVDPWFDSHLPTNEALVQFFYDRLEPELKPATIKRIKVAEHPDLFAELIL